MSGFTRSHLKNAIVGFSATTVFLGLTLSYNIAGLRDFSITTDGAWHFLLALWFMNGVVFTAIQGMVAKLLNRDDDEGPRGGRRDDHRQHDMIPIRVEIRNKNQRHRK